jgi:hypothetical protein
MNKKNFRAAFEQINLILKSNTIKDDFEAKNNQRRKRLGINKNFKSLKTYQNIRVKPKIVENTETRMDLNEKEFNAIFLLLERIENELSKENMEENSFNYIYKKRNTIFQNIKQQPLMDYTNFKELEKFFIFICNLSLFQLKILNDSQPEYSQKRDDLPIIFTTPFRDCLTNSQRMDLDQLETMNLTRYIILVDSKKDISPENLDYKYMKYKIKTPANNDEEEGEVLLSFDEDDNNSFKNGIKNNYKNNTNINLKKGRNSPRKNNLESKGLFSSSTNNNNSSTMRKTITTATLRKRTSEKKSLTFNDDSDDVNSLDLMFRSLRDEKNAKFMNKNRKFIMEYLYGLDKKEKKFLLDNPISLQKMMDRLSDKIRKKTEKKTGLNKNKNNIIKLNSDISISFSYEVSQQSQIQSKKG